MQSLAWASTGRLVGAGKNATMLANDLSLGDDDDAFGAHPHADRMIGEGCRHAVAIAVQMDQAPISLWLRANESTTLPK
jgi:hypothetical protein